MRNYMNKNEKYTNLELHRVAVAARDITCAVESFSLMIEMKADQASDLYMSLLFGAVVSYCRPFTNNDGLGKSSKKWSQFGDTNLTELHIELIDYRNNVVAHSDIKNNKLLIFPSGVNVQVGEDLITTDVPFFAIKTPLLNDDRIKSYIDLGKFQIDRMYGFLIPEMEARYMNKDIPPIPFEFRHDE